MNTQEILKKCKQKYNDCIQNRKWEEALIILDEMIFVQETARLRALKAINLFKLKKYEEAKQEAIACLKIDKNYSKAIRILEFLDKESLHKLLDTAPVINEPKFIKLVLKKNGNESLLPEPIVLENGNHYIFGRSLECYYRLPADPSISRQHFLIDVNFPYVILEDTESSSGTIVNNIKYGGEICNNRTVYLKNKDSIHVGNVILIVEIPFCCCECNQMIEVEKIANAKISSKENKDIYICDECREKIDMATVVPNIIQKFYCCVCNKDISNEIPNPGQGEYTCKDCQNKPEQMFLGQYALIKEIGKGAMGRVYLAESEKKEKFALKVMSSQIAVNEKSRLVFNREILEISKLDHPNVVKLYDHGSDGGFYFVMEYCEKGNLSELIKKNTKLSLEVSIKIITQALEGLAHIHQRGSVHRDLKPANILIDEHNNIKIGDFGLAKNFVSAGFSGLTATGMIAGTPDFMPKEQITNYKYVNPSSDVWSMGAIFYFLLTNKKPRPLEKQNSILDKLKAIKDSKVVPIEQHNLDLPNNIVKCLSRALHENPDKRYQNAKEFLHDLQK